jgi:hypothetical protein
VSTPLAAQAHGYFVSLLFSLVFALNSPCQP